MTKPAKTFSQKVKGEISLGKNNKLVISIVDSPAYPQKFLDVRLHVDNLYGYKGATTKGIRLPAEHMPQFIKIINELFEEVTEGKFK